MIIIIINCSVVFQPSSDYTAAMDVDGADDDDYVLTPLQPEAGDPEPDIEKDDGSDGVDEVADDTATAADDYVQSLVTIESNWANGKFITQTVISSRIFRGTRLMHCLRITCRSDDRNG
ncbi:protein TANC2 isoform X3 [Aphis craccivora]|uniref:Protein TANC2 isoform X3 n=1 Tax=Aphis craccivora TaxID=307492 RepID=A0A6G0Y9S3_APHCR|nr:protein TANC2 isoform X3 [Aphis craccivora]